MQIFQSLKECQEPDENRPNINGVIETSIDSDSVYNPVELKYTLTLRTNSGHYESLIQLAEQLKYESIYLAIFAEKKLKQ